MKKNDLLEMDEIALASSKESKSGYTVLRSANSPFPEKNKYMIEHIPEDVFAQFDALIGKKYNLKNNFFSRISEISGQTIKECYVDVYDPPVNSRSYSSLMFGGVAAGPALTSLGIVDTLLSKGKIYAHKDIRVSERMTRNRLGRDKLSLRNLDFRRIDEIKYEPKKEAENKDNNGYMDLKLYSVGIFFPHNSHDERHEVSDDELNLWERSDEGKIIHFYEGEGKKFMFELDKDKKLLETTTRMIKKGKIRNAVENSLRWDSRLSDVSIINYMLHRGDVGICPARIECNIITKQKDLSACFPISSRLDLEESETMHSLEAPPKIAIGLSFLNTPTLKIRQDKKPIERYIS